MGCCGKPCGSWGENLFTRVAELGVLWETNALPIKNKGIFAVGGGP